MKDAYSKRVDTDGKTEGENGVAQPNSSNWSELSVAGAFFNGGGPGGEIAVGWMGKGGHADIETETATEGMGEGTLVWAKMRVSWTLSLNPLSYFTISFRATHFGLA